MQIRLYARIYIDDKRFDGELIFDTPYASQEETTIHVQWKPLEDMPVTGMALSVKQYELWQVLKQFKGASRERSKWAQQRSNY